MFEYPASLTAWVVVILSCYTRDLSCAHILQKVSNTGSRSAETPWTCFSKLPHIRCSNRPLPPRAPRRVQGVSFFLYTEEAEARVNVQVWGHFKGQLRVLGNLCTLCHCHVTPPLFMQRSDELEHVGVVETTWKSTKSVRARLQNGSKPTEQRDTISGVKELLQSSRSSLQLLILKSLQNHLQEVKLFHQSGFRTALGLVFLKSGKYRISLLPSRIHNLQECYLPPTGHKSPAWAPPTEDLWGVSLLPKNKQENRKIEIWCHEVSEGGSGTCLFSSVLLCFTDVVWRSDISHNALCHVVN